MRYLLHLSYSGKNYCGWQRQDNAISVQETIEENLSKLLGATTEIIGCGRTDAGVHAKNYYAHFDTDKLIANDFLYRINSMLPEDIAIQNSIAVHTDFHARFDAINRTYKYFIHFQKNPFNNDNSFCFRGEAIDMEQMNFCIQQLIGEHDFSTFEKKGSDNKTSICLLEFAHWEKTADGLVFTITANRFLRNMVRRITATLLLVGQNKLNAEDVINAVLNQQALDVKLAVPAKGLFLWNIEYEILKNL